MPTSRTPPASANRIDDWDVVRQLKPGSRVEVRTIQGKRSKGKIGTVSDTTLELDVNGQGGQIFQRDNIRELQRGHRFSVGQHAGLGLLIGGGTGLLIGLATPCDGNDCDGRQLATAVLPALGFMIGGVTGFIAGESAHHSASDLIYTKP